MSAPFVVSLFHDVFAKEVIRVDGTIEDLAATIRSTTAPIKAQLPLFKLARFGDAPLPKTGSLRHDQNLIACSGIEVDYDAGLISFDEACERLLKANIAAVVFTTPSHSEERPRWRVVAPTSEEIPPHRRAQMVDRINGALGGGVAAESWTLSQSYYYGHVEGAQAFRVEVIDGEFIDLLDDLDLTAIGKPAGANGAGAALRGNGHDGVTFDEAALKEAIRTGTGYHESCTRLLGRWAHDGVSLMDAEARLFALFDETDPAIRDARWADIRADVPRTVEG